MPAFTYCFLNFHVGVFNDTGIRALLVRSQGDFAQNFVWLGEVQDFFRPP
jgi:hypothetical protein